MWGRACVCGGMRVRACQVWCAHVRLWRCVCMPLTWSFLNVRCAAGTCTCSMPPTNGVNRPSDRPGLYSTGPTTSSARLLRKVTLLYAIIKEGTYIYIYYTANKKVYACAFCTYTSHNEVCVSRGVFNLLPLSGQRGSARLLFRSSSRGTCARFSGASVCVFVLHIHITKKNVVYVTCFLSAAALACSFTAAAEALARTATWQLCACSFCTYTSHDVCNLLPLRGQRGSTRLFFRSNSRGTCARRSGEYVCVCVLYVHIT